MRETPTGRETPTANGDVARYREAPNIGAVARSGGGARPQLLGRRPKPLKRWAASRTTTSHRAGAAIWLPVAAESATMQMMLGNGFGFNWQGLYVTSMLDFHSAWRTRAYELSDSLKNTMLLGHYIVTRYRGHYYANAQNLVRRLRRAYDEVLARCDLLLMPTVPMVATPLPEPARTGRGGPRPRLRNVSQHRPVRLHLSPGDEPPLRHRRRAAGRDDAGGENF